MKLSSSSIAKLISFIITLLTALSSILPAKKEEEKEDK